MKKLAKLLGFITLILVIGFSMIACDGLFGDKDDKDDNDENGGGSGSSIDNGISVIVGNSSSHSINQNGKHWFKFVGTGETIIFETSGNIVDTYMVVWSDYDTAKGEWEYLGGAVRDNDSGEGQNALATINTVSGTTYYVRITPQSSTSGMYNLVVTAPTANIRTNPISFSLGNSSSYVIASSGQHWFSFQGNGQSIIIETEGNVVTTNMEIFIGSNTNSDFSEGNKISISAISGTTYYIRITGNSGTYTLKIYNGAGDGSSASFSLPITLGYTSSHSINQNGKHWFSFMGTGETIVFETTGNIVDTYMVVWEDHSNARGEWEYLGGAVRDDNSGEGQNALATINTISDVMYFIRITPLSSTSGTYTFIARNP